MWLLLPILAVAFLLIVAVEDIRKNLISLKWIIAAAIFLLIYHLYSSSTFDFLFSSALNLLTVFILMAGCQLYVTLSNRRWVPLFENYMGYGDLVLLLVLAIGLSQLDFVLVLIIGILFGLAYGLIGTFFIHRTSNIPLAGLLAISATCFIVSEHIFSLGTANTFFTFLLQNQ